MQEFRSAFISKDFLRSIWAIDYEAFKDSDEEQTLFNSLTLWSQRADLRERSAQPAFIQEFFHTIWGYRQSGQVGVDEPYTIFPEYPVEGAGAGGGVGSADAALGSFQYEDGTTFHKYSASSKTLGAPWTLPNGAKEIPVPR